MNEPRMLRLLDMVGVKFVTAAMLAAQAKVANGLPMAIIAGETTKLSSMALTVQETAVGKVTRAQLIATEGISIVHAIVILMAMAPRRSAGRPRWTE